MRLLVASAASVMFVLGLSAIILLILRSRREARQLPKPKVDVDWEFSDDHLIATTPDSQETYHWQDVRKWRESDKLFIVDFKPIKPIIVVKHELKTDENVLAFRALLITKLGPAA